MNEENKVIEQETINIKALGSLENRHDFIAALLEQKDIIQGTVVDTEEIRAAYRKLAKKGPVHYC